ncbi:MAG: hypothetical protein EBQ96_01710 [Proteobacteria bacterium]|nr:hypothetical protein [Pseudomonadota bacterium]
MQNTLLVLSELDASPFDARNGFRAAAALKGLGAARADITQDPRLIYAEAHGAYARPVPNFEKAATVLAESVFRPIIGQSDAVYLNGLTARRLIMPTIQQLSAAGAVFARSVLGEQAGHGMSERDGQDIGLIFFLALHGKTAKGQPYDGLVHASLSGATCEALELLSPHIVGKRLDTFGTAIHLGALRRTLTKIHGADLITRTFEQRYVM